METVNPTTPANSSGVPPPPFLPNMSLAQIQALGILGYLPPFPSLNFIPPNFNPHAPLDLSKSGYEPIVSPVVSQAMSPVMSPDAQVEGTQGSELTKEEEESMDAEDSTQQSSPLQTVGSLLENMEEESGDQGDSDEQRKPIQERVRQKRQTLQDMTRSLKQWLYHHRDNPYPSKSEKVQLAKSSQMTMTQVSNWFANARRRLKNTVRGPELSWAKRIKLYNNCIEGNQELLSVGSSSSDDDLTGELTTGDTEQNCDLDADCAPRVPDIQERLSEQCHQAEISDTSALDDQGERKEDNLQARLQGDSHSAPQPQAFDLHKTSAPWNFSTIKQQPSCQKNIMIPLVLDAKQTTSTLSALPLLPTSQSTDLPATQEQPNQAISGFGENIGDSGDTHPKYKQTIMQRYLTDSYNSYQNALLSLSTPVNKDPKENERHRNPSGSLSSHDYEEYMSSASSARSTPTREHQEGHLDEYEEFSRHWPDIKTRAEDDLYWKEISAALALTSLARSRHPAQSQ